MDIDDRVHDHFRPKPRVAVFGGGFNPPHFTHQTIIAWLLSTGKADQVWLVPCWRHVFGKRLAPFRDRLAMCREAAGIFHHLCQVSDIERRIGGRSVMLNTLRELRSRHPGNEFSLVIGEDNWLRRAEWVQFDVLEKEFPVLVVGRDCQPRLPDIRSTMVRSRIAAGEDVGDMVPAGALAIIRERGLYCRKP